MIVGFKRPSAGALGFMLSGNVAPERLMLAAAGFAAAVAGAALVWLAAFVKLLPARGVGGEAGLFMIMFVVGLAWSAIGYWMRPGAKG